VPFNFKLYMTSSPGVFEDLDHLSVISAQGEDEIPITAVQGIENRWERGLDAQPFHPSESYPLLVASPFYVYLIRFLKRVLRAGDSVTR